MATKKVKKEVEHEYTIYSLVELQFVVDEKTYNKLLNEETNKVDPEKILKIKEKDCKFFSQIVKKFKTFER